MRREHHKTKRNKPYEWEHDPTTNYPVLKILDPELMLPFILEVRKRRRKVFETSKGGVQMT